MALIFWNNKYRLSAKIERGLVVNDSSEVLYVQVFKSEINIKLHNLSINKFILNPHNKHNSSRNVQT